MLDTLPLSTLASLARTLTPDANVMPVYYQNPAGLSADQIRQAFEAARNFYYPAISIQAQPLPTANVAMQNKFYSVIFSNDHANKIADDGGQTIAAARRAYIYPNALQAQFGRNDPRALDYSLSHEIGHLLGLKHSLSGIMQPNLTRQEIDNPMPSLSRGQTLAVLSSLAPEGSQ